MEKVFFVKKGGGAVQTKDKGIADDNEDEN